MQLQINESSVMTTAAAQIAYKKNQSRFIQVEGFRGTLKVHFSEC